MAARFLERGAGAVVPGLEPLAELSVARAERLAPLPYAEPGFSERVLGAHLDRTTDRSSRRPATIRRQVEWLRGRLPRRALANVFHPLCGPGLFAAALRGAGTRTYLGVDSAPAAIGHARGRAWPAGFAFRHADVLDPSAQPPPGSFALALLTYEALNAFPPRRALRLLRLARRALEPGGALAAEVRTTAPAPGTFAPRSADWRPEGSIFAADPHLLLTEWAVLGRDAQVMGHRFIVVRQAGHVDVHHSLVWRYDRARLRALLTAAGFCRAVIARPQRIATDQPDSLEDRFVIARATPARAPVSSRPRTGPEAG